MRREYLYTRSTPHFHDNQFLRRAVPPTDYEQNKIPESGRTYNGVIFPATWVLLGHNCNLGGSGTGVKVNPLLPIYQRAMRPSGRLRRSSLRAPLVIMTMQGPLASVQTLSDTMIKMLAHCLPLFCLFLSVITCLSHAWVLLWRENLLSVIHQSQHVIPCSQSFEKFKRPLPTESVPYWGISGIHSRLGLVRQTSELSFKQFYKEPGRHSGLWGCRRGLESPR